MLRSFVHYPGEKILYIAPLKALVRERISDWGKNLCKRIKKSMVELTGDYTPDLAALLAADIIICTPEKWDGISRNWQARGYVKMVRLVIMDEIHLLGSDRGPTLEVIVSRMRYIAGKTEKKIRFVGLSTALANAHDLASWLGVPKVVRSIFAPYLLEIWLSRCLQPC
jgi:activating signal cointegrator complex subunit 3